MPVIVEPLPHFRTLSEAAVIEALSSPDAAHPVAVEVARLIAGYSANVKALVKRLGYLPADLLHVKPRWPIEAVAMRLTSDAIREEMNKG